MKIRCPTREKISTSKISSWGLNHFQSLLCHEQEKYFKKKPYNGEILWLGHAGEFALSTRQRQFQTKLGMN